MARIAPTMPRGISASRDCRVVTHQGPMRISGNRAGTCGMPPANSLMSTGAPVARVNSSEKVFFILEYDGLICRLGLGKVSLFVRVVATFPRETTAEGLEPRVESDGDDEELSDRVKDSTEIAVAESVGYGES